MMTEMNHHKYMMDAWRDPLLVEGGNMIATWSEQPAVRMDGKHDFQASGSPLIFPLFYSITNIGLA